MNRKAVLLSAGILLLGLALLLPGGPPAGDPPELVAQETASARLLKLGFAVEGLILLALRLAGARWPAMSREDLFELPPPEGRNVRHPLLWLAAVTALGLLLRLYRIGSDLWLDEITTVLAFRNVSAFGILSVYKTSNNQLLNTLSVQGMISLFGPVEWAVRLPAVILGVACIPALYALARVALGQRESLFAALLLAVSYHHIFFSQNARGYTGLLLWSMLGTVFFLRALAGDRARDWALYVVAMLAAVATILYGLFVIAGHVASFAVGCFLMRLKGKRIWPLTRRVLLVWTALGLLCLHLYAGIVAEVNAYLGNIYTRPSVGYAPFSAEHFRELARGLSAGFGNATIAGALAALLVMGFGFALFLRRHTLYAITLVAPLPVTAGFLLARNLNFSPRFFLWGVPVVWIFAVATATSLEVWLRSRRPMAGALAQGIARVLPFLVVGALLALSALSLPAYYRTPKQPNRTSLVWLAARRGNEDPVVAAFQAKHGLRFYGPRMGLTEDHSFFIVDTAAGLQMKESAWSGKTVWLLTTFPRAMRLEHPDLDGYIRQHYRRARTFAATIGDGEVAVFTRELPR